MANQTLKAISGIATVRSAPLDSMGYESTTPLLAMAGQGGGARAVRMAVAIIMSSR